VPFEHHARGGIGFAGRINCCPPTVFIEVIVGFHDHLVDEGRRHAINGQPNTVGG
jgi:hypothetical protein